MKKILFLGAMAAMLLGTASCSSDMEPAMGGETPTAVPSVTAPVPTP